jgi:hypothetical protein
MCMGKFAAAAHQVLERVSPTEDVHVIAATTVDLVHAPVRRLEVCSGGLPRPLVIGPKGCGGRGGGRWGEGVSCSTREGRGGGRWCCSCLLLLLLTLGTSLQNALIGNITAGL